MTSTNLNNKDKQVVVTIDGVRYTLSPKLTADFRSKKVSISELGEYYVREVEGENGTTFLSLGYPSDDIQVKLAGWKASKVEKKEVTLEELMELVAF